MKRLAVIVPWVLVASLTLFAINQTALVRDLKIELKRKEAEVQQLGHDMGYEAYERQRLTQELDKVRR